MDKGTRQYDLEERVVKFAVMVIDVVDEIPVSRAGNHIAGQLIRSGTAPAANYGEAQSAESRTDFVHKMKLSLKELKETRVWLCILFRKTYFKNKKLVDVVSSECNELIRIFAKSILTAS